MTLIISDLSFDSLPNEVAQLKSEVRAMKQMLLEMSSKPRALEDELFTVEQCAEFLKLSKPTIYGLISKGELPVMKRSKRCYFSKQELMEYLKKGRKKSNTDIEAEAERYLWQKGDRK